MAFKLAYAVAAVGAVTANPARAGERPGNVKWCETTSHSAMKVSLQRAASESESESERERDIYIYTHHRIV